MDSYKTSLQDQMAIQTFVNKLIEERKDPEVTAETLPAVRSLLIKKVNEAINEHFVSLLSDADVKELDTLLEGNIPDNQLNEFFKKKIDNISVEIATALLNFRAAYLYPVWKKQQEEQSKATLSKQGEEKTKIADTDHLPPAPVV